MNFYENLTNADLDRLALEADRSAVSGLDVVCMSSVQSRPIEWLWQNWIAVGKVSMLAGEGGQGKSTILCDLAARTTRGDRWPDGADKTAPGGVIILAAEDDAEDTLKPRLLAAGADVDRVFNIRAARNDDQSRRTFNLQLDLERLERVITERDNIRLVIIDPISSYLGKGVDSHKNADVRSVLEPIGEMAARTRTAVLCNNHFSKGGGSANNRMIGSVGFVNYVRTAFIVTPDAETEGRMFFMPSKMNIAPIKYGMAYRIEGYLVTDGDNEVLTSRIAWETEPVSMSADSALAAHEASDESRTGKEEAIDFLKSVLAGGKIAANVVKSQATSIGITAKSLRSAREALHIVTGKEGMEGPFTWELPILPSPPDLAPFQKRATSASEGKIEDDQLDPDAFERVIQ